MGNLSKWIEDKKIASINSDEYDITTNIAMRKFFFSQIEDLDFDYEVKDDNSIYLYTRLTYPNFEFRPFNFLLDTKKMILTPQYTETHRNLIIEPDSDEYKTLKNLITYIEDDYMRNKTKGFKKVVVNNNFPSNSVLVARVTGNYIRGGAEFIIDSPLQFDGTETITIYYKNKGQYQPIFVSKGLSKNEEIEFNEISHDNIGIKHIFTKNENNVLEIIIFGDIFNNESFQNFSAEIIRNTN